MYVHEKAVFIAHPKTASSSVGHVLNRDAAWKKIGEHHHVIPESIPKGIPVIGLIREPQDWYVSWFHDHHPRKAVSGVSHAEHRVKFRGWFERFIEGGEKRWSLRHGVQWGGKYRCLYGLPLITHLLFFDRLAAGWSAMWQELGLEPFVLPHKHELGRWAWKAHYWFEDDLVELLDRKRPDYIRVYKQLAEMRGDGSVLNVSSGMIDSLWGPGDVAS